jgi:hypothetical protein
VCGPHTSSSSEVLLGKESCSTLLCYSMWKHCTVYKGTSVRGHLLMQPPLVGGHHHSAPLGIPCSHWHACVQYLYSPKQSTLYKRLFVVCGVDGVLNVEVLCTVYGIDPLIVYTSNKGHSIMKLSAKGMVRGP